MKIRQFSSVLALAGWFWVSVAHASDAQPETHRLELPAGFRRADSSDYALTLAGLAGSGVLVLGFSTAGEPRFQGPVLFDDEVRRALAASSRSSRDGYALASNLTLYGSMGWVALDAVGVAWLGDHNARVARELFWMDVEAYSVSLLLTTATKSLFRRQRPYAAECARDSNYDSHCGTADENASFFSGHSSWSGTSAGLICAQHRMFPLYGNAALDAAACGGALATMTATGLLRIASDNHWASDVAVGYLVGFATGYGLPQILHTGGARQARHAGEGLRVRVLPVANGSDFRLLAVGAF